MKQFLFGLLMLIGFGAHSQEFDSRLLKVYSADILNQMKQSDESNYRMLIYALDNACYLTDLPEGKSIELETITLSSLENICFTDAGKKITNQNQYYHIAGTNQMLVIKSEWVLTNEMSLK